MSMARPHASCLRQKWKMDAYVEGYGHDGQRVCLSDVQTEAEGVPSQCGRTAPAHAPTPGMLNRDCASSPQLASEF